MVKAEVISEQPTPTLRLTATVVPVVVAVIGWAVPLNYVWELALSPLVIGFLRNQPPGPRDRAGSKEDFWLPTVDFVPLGKHRLKGLADELELLEVRPRSEERAERVTDPVCGMELTQVGVAVRLSLEGTDVSVRSERCPHLFVGSRTR